MKPQNLIILQLAGFTLCTLLHFICVNAGSNELYSDSISSYHVTVTLPLFDAVLTPSGNLMDITSRFKQKHRTALSNQFSAAPITPLLQLFPEYTASPFRVSKEQSSNDSVCNVIFTSDTKSITWRFNVNRYVFEVITSRRTLSDTIAISTTDTTATKQKYSALVLAGNSVKHLKKNILFNAEKNVHYWVGIRDHFWVFLVRPNAGIMSIHSKNTGITIHTTDSLPAGTSSFTVYAGPVTMKTLRDAGKECTFLLYPLWFWMRWLSIALLYLFNAILSITGNPVIAIVLLSLCVKIIIAPLYSIAAHWQNEVNRQKSLLEPRLLEINRNYKGEEHTKRTLAVHKELGISPLYALKSLLSAAIQIPVFFAAYHMLSEHIALAGVSFLWINDLAYPDRLIRLPFTVPLFGEYLNIFPFLMTAVSLISSFVHSDGSLSEQLHKKQQRSLFIMAAAFFLLLYTSPAGMLLYWTMNNIVSLLESLYTANKQRKILKNNKKDTLP